MFDSCYLYIMQIPTGYFKIGISKDPKRRLKGLNTSSPERIDIVFFIKLSSEKNARIMEKLLHKKLGSYNSNGEWFRANKEVIATCLFDCLSELNFPTEINQSTKKMVRRTRKEYKFNNIECIYERIEAGHRRATFSKVTKGDSFFDPDNIGDIYPDETSIEELLHYISIESLNASVISKERLIQILNLLKEMDLIEELRQGVYRVSRRFS